jgi:uncharacterized membrane protein YbjE (DUF340 family)
MSVVKALELKEGIQRAIEAKQLPISSESIWNPAFIIFMIAALSGLLIHLNFSDKVVHNGVAENITLALMLLVFAIGLWRLRSARKLSPVYIEMVLSKKTVLLEQLLKQSKELKGFIVTPGYAVATKSASTYGLDLTILYDDNGFYLNASYRPMAGSAAFEIRNTRKKLIDAFTEEIHSYCRRKIDA